jgi:hypothetical protein
MQAPGPGPVVDIDDKGKLDPIELGNKTNIALRPHRNKHACEITLSEIVFSPVFVDHEFLFGQGSPNPLC